MASEQNEGAEQATNNTPAVVSWTGMIEERYKKMKAHAEAYPYVWGSYLVVYGGFGLWFTYRWRRLRRTEDRVRGLQKRLRELVEAEEKQSLPSADKNPTK